MGWGVEDDELQAVVKGGGRLAREACRGPPVHLQIETINLYIKVFS